jgi:hypothetical protein
VETEKQTGGGGLLGSLIKAPTSTPASTYKLPTQKSTPVESINECIILVYGEKKIGKTSLVAGFPETFFAMFEPGATGLSIFKDDVRDWGHFQEIVGALERSPGQFKTVAIDTVDMAYEMCFKWYCKREGITHPSEGGFGVHWKGIENEFRTQLTRLLKSGRGVIFISHCADKEFELKTGAKYNKVVPTMGKQASSFITAFADIIGYYGYYGDQRFLTIRGSDEVESGTRLKYRFWVKGHYPKWLEDPDFDAMSEDYDGDDDAVRVHSVPMGSDEVQAYRNFMRAFNNLQENDGDPRTHTQLSNVPAKMTKKQR